MKTILFLTYGHSGTAWLWNCFLESNIRVDDIPAFMFDRTNTANVYSLKTDTAHLNTFLPAISCRNEFSFADDYFVHLTQHRIPTPEEASENKIILFSRDPRDTLISQWRWAIRNGDLRSFADYLDATVRTWIDFHERALKFPNVGVFHFEQYKLNPEQCLREVLAFAGIDRSDANIQRALQRSSSENAKRAEYRYLLATPPEQRHYPISFNTSGSYQKWSQERDGRSALESVFQASRGVLTKLGYFTSDGRYAYPPGNVRREVVRRLAISNPSGDRSTSGRDGAPWVDESAKALNTVEDYWHRAAEAIRPILNATVSGNIRWRKACIDKAIGILEKGLESYPKAWVLHFSRARWLLLFVPDRTDLARTLFRRMIDNNESMDLAALPMRLQLGGAGAEADPIFPYLEYEEIVSRRSDADVLNEAAKKAKRALLSCCYGYLGWTHEKSAEWRLATENFEKALAIFPDNSNLKYFKLQVLWKLIGVEPNFSHAYYGPFISAFYEYAKYDCRVVVTDGRKAMKALYELRLEGQLSALLDDWYKFASSATSLEVEQLTELFHYEDWLHRRLATIWIPNRLGR